MSVTCGAATTTTASCGSTLVVELHLGTTSVPCPNPLLAQNKHTQVLIFVSSGVDICISRCWSLYVQVLIFVSPGVDICISRCWYLYLQVLIFVVPGVAISWCCGWCGGMTVSTNDLRTSIVFENCRLLCVLELISREKSEYYQKCRIKIHDITLAAGTSIKSLEFHNRGWYSLLVGYIGRPKLRYKDCIIILKKVNNVNLNRQDV